MFTSLKLLFSLLILQLFGLTSSAAIEDTLIRSRKKGSLSVDVAGDSTEFATQTNGADLDAYVDHSGAVSFDKSLANDQQLSQMRADQLLVKIQEMVASKDKAEPSKIKVIQDLVKDELLPKLQSTRDIEARELKSIHGDMNKCNDQALQSQNTTSNTLEAAVVTSRSENSKCRHNEVELLGGKTEKCTAFKQFADSITVPATLPQGQTPDAMAEYLQRMDAYFCGKGKQATQYKEACDTATSAYANAKTQCNSKQSTFESSFCQWRTRVTDTCGALDTCWKNAANQYTTRNKAAQVLVKQWEVEYASLHKILCYTKVWLRTTSSKTDAMQYKECDNLKPDTTSMHIEELPLTSKQKCDLNSSQEYPGTPAFLKEYSDFANHTVDVTACSVVDTTTSTSETCPNSNGVTGYSESHNGWWAGFKHIGTANTTQACADRCNERDACVAFSRNKPKSLCFWYEQDTKGDKIFNKDWINDAYVRCGRKAPVVPKPPTCANSRNIMGYYESHNGWWQGYKHIGTAHSTQECADMCNKRTTCVAFSRNKPQSQCYWYEAETKGAEHIHKEWINDAFIRCGSNASMLIDVYGEGSMPEDAEGWHEA
jgi:hypothetical protein